MLLMIVVYLKKMKAYILYNILDIHFLDIAVIDQGNRIKIPTTFSDIQYLMPLCTIFSSY
mgnify:CR=1 FL=1